MYKELQINKWTILNKSIKQRYMIVSTESSFNSNTSSSSFNLHLIHQSTCVIPTVC
jgi:hypothetical protein